MLRFRGLVGRARPAPPRTSPANPIRNLALSKPSAFSAAQALITLGLVGGVTGFLIAYTDNDLRRAMFQDAIPSHVFALGQRWTPDLQKLASAKSLAFFSGSYRYCQALVEEGAVEACVAAIEDSDDPALAAFVAAIFANVSSFDGLRASLMEERTLAALARLLTFERSQARAQRTLLNLLQFGEDPYTVLAQVKLGSLAFVENPEGMKSVTNVLARLLAQRSLRPCETARNELLTLLLRYADRGAERGVVLRALANLCSREDEVAAPLPPPLTAFLSKLLDNKDANLSLEEQQQACRLLANLSSEASLKDEVATPVALGYLRSQLNSSDADASFSALAALANLASSPTTLLFFTTPTVGAELLALAEVDDSLRPLRRAQVARLFCNLSSQSEGSPVETIFNPERFPALLALSADPEPDVARFAAQTFAQMAVSPSLAHELAASEEFWEQLRRWTDTPALHVPAAMIIANLALHQPATLRADATIMAALKRLVLSKDEVVRAEALRAQASLADLRLKAPKYAEGINLLYPLPGTPASLSEPDFDLVFIHGVTGDPLSTWRHGPEIPGNPVHEGSWPRDIIPKDFPRSRVISIGYEVFLTEWGGKSLPLKTQSRILLQRLKLAALGRRPVVFVAHSFGGLIVKEMLRYASSHPEYAHILNQTKGIVFYSTPHHGCYLEHYRNGYTDVVYRGNPINDDITPSLLLQQLNEDLPKVAKGVRTLSFGEGVTCFGFGTKYDCIQIVVDESANPGYSETEGHRFIKTNYNHRDVCKPDDETDPRYTFTREFIRTVLGDLARKSPQM